ncbi:MAG: DNA-formamidopyrimidine glycosylase [Legionella sp. 40-6]|nr:MAG: DNA-formamidopyrimidine glycosylase [Legionella sp. 40-6]
MSGHLRIVDNTVPVQKHDHIDVILENQLILRFSDPRRFGIFTYIEHDPNEHQLIKSLGPEPLTDSFNAQYLTKKIKNRKKSIKSVIMDNQVVVGVGNIYATESLFRAKIHPAKSAHDLGDSELDLLVFYIKQILNEAIIQGGTTLKDFYGFDGKPGYFRLALQAYGRNQLPCVHCTTPLESLVIGGRSSVYCPQCQN